MLGITPSAVSQSLTRLRSFFDDPLFMRDGKKLVATTVAENLHEHLSGGFSQLINSLGYLSDTSAKSKVIIHSTSYAAMRLLPVICSQIEEQSLPFEISHIVADAVLDNDEDVLIYRKADIIFDTKPYYSPSTITEPFITENVVPVCRKDHPRLGTTLTREEMQRENSTQLNVGSNSVKRAQSEAYQFFGERKFFFSSSSIIATIAVAEATNCVSFIPRWFANKVAGSFNIKILESDFCSEPVNFHMTYNKSSMKNNSFVELLKIINKCKNLYEYIH